MTEPGGRADRPALHSRSARLNGIEIYWKESGSGPPVVLLHGFPEFWYSWRNQLPPLAAAGHRVVAPDLRGYNLSEKPRAVGAYRLSTLVADTAALIEHLGAPASLVGHDWGGVIAWYLAMTRPELLRKLVVIDIPHPAPLIREIRRSTRQKFLLTYQLLFQPPLVPELLMRRVLPPLMRRSGRFNETDIAAYREAWAQPGAPRAMANYYRAFWRYRGDTPRLRRIDIPTMLIWGEGEPVFIPATTEDFAEWVPDCRVERVAGARHFVQTDAPEEVTRLLREFLSSSRAV